MTPTLDIPDIHAGTRQPPLPPIGGRISQGPGGAVPPGGRSGGGGTPPTGRSGGGGEITPFDAPEPGESVTGIAAYGTLIQVLASPGPPETYVTIEGVGDIAGPTTSIAEAETTSHSTGAPVRTFIPTLIDPGDISFPCFWNPSDPTQSISSIYGMESLFWSRTVTKFQLITPDPTHRTRQFKGYVKSISEAYPLAGIMTRNASIRITSPMVDVASAIFVLPPSQTVLAAGGPATFDVSTGGNNAPWQAQSDSAWITVDAPVGVVQGDDTVTCTVALNDTAPVAPRVGHVHIAALALTFTVNQGAA